MSFLFYFDHFLYFYNIVLLQADEIDPGRAGAAMLVLSVPKNNRHETMGSRQREQPYAATGYIVDLD